ncbi:adenylyltransferase/cytidyltransferase family protein [Marinilactibacillus psychrotolerans]|uniref:adenylyltransferase/cytidyltransferase family protein n=1 Tax=Marinilactibacillus psychrotolerans TaxID=191770 RepID=UPI003887EFEC
MTKIGYTTGVFDLFHVGHLNILKKAKEQCDYLIVGVTTDEEVERVKSKRPFIPFEERAEIVQAICYVDKVVPEENTDKLKAWEQLKYHRIFKGDDWKGTEKWKKYEEEFSKRDVEVIYFSYTKGTSSTQIRQALQLSIDQQSQ